MNFITNSLNHKEFRTVRGKDIFDILEINEELYETLKIIKNVCFSRCLEFKVTNPGEQMTSTFNQMVLEDEPQWYNGPYYRY